MSWHPIRRHRNHLFVERMRAERPPWPPVDLDDTEPLPAPISVQEVGAGSTRRVRIVIAQRSAAA